MKYESLQGQVAVVTGASSGIGAAVARALAHGGAHVALAARRLDALLEVQAGLDDRVKSLVAATDVTDRRQVKSLVARTEEELGPVDILVNWLEEVSAARSLLRPLSTSLVMSRSAIRVRSSALHNRLT